jgi:UDPglucose 6-dehydrogenase
MSKICVIGTGYEGALVRAYDPQAMENAARVLNNVTLCETPYQVAENADALVLATEWNEFKQLDFERVGQLMHQKLILDGRNQWDADRLRSLGFTYFGIGRAANGS